MIHFVKMASIDMTNNDIQTIEDIAFFGIIENLWLDNNNIRVLQNLPATLKRLYIRNNLIETLENLPEELEELWINNNNIKVISNLPSKLKKLYINNNQVSHILSLPISIEVIQILNNPLVEIPHFVMGLSNLYICSFNTDTIFPQNFRKMLKDKIIERNQVVDVVDDVVANVDDVVDDVVDDDIADDDIVDVVDDIVDDDIVDDDDLFDDDYFEPQDELNIYSDTQNVHDTSIQSSLTISINNIIKGSKMSENELYDSMYNSELTQSVLANIFKNINDKTIHEKTGCTYLDILCYVFKYICDSEHYNDLIKVLEQEIIDGSDLCFVGRLTRLVNVLSGYHEGVNLTIDDKAQIGNIAVLLQSKYSDDVLKEEFTKEMKERGFSDDVINEWIQHF